MSGGYGLHAGLLCLEDFSPALHCLNYTSRRWLAVHYLAPSAQVGDSIRWLVVVFNKSLHRSDVVAHWKPLLVGSHVQ